MEKSARLPVYVLGSTCLQRSVHKAMLWMLVPEKGEQKDKSIQLELPPLFD